MWRSAWQNAWVNYFNQRKQTMKNLNTLSKNQLLQAQAVIEQLLKQYPKFDIEMYASTVEVNAITRKVYDWKLLRKFCIENDLDIPKYQHCSLAINEYPDVAWKEVYGVDIAELFPQRMVA